MSRQADITERLASVFERSQAVVLGEVITAAYEDLVKTSDFNELKAIVKDLAEAQGRTEKRMEELSAAQARTEKRMEELSAAQARTEKRVEELAEAQGRTDQRVDRLAVNVDKLAEAQRRTEIAMGKLAKQVGGLSETVGGDIEDIAYIVLHDVLHREFGWQVGVLERQWKQWGKQPEEVNIFGQATDPARPNTTIWIVGEAKHNLSTREARRFIKQLERARQHLSGEIFPVCFCYRARPEVQTMIQKAGIRLVFSYGKLV